MNLNAELDKILDFQNLFFKGKKFEHLFSYFNLLQNIITKIV